MEGGKTQVGIVESVPNKAGGAKLRFKGSKPCDDRSEHGGKDKVLSTQLGENYGRPGNSVIRFGSKTGVLENTISKSSSKYTKVQSNRSAKYRHRGRSNGPKGGHTRNKSVRGSVSRTPILEGKEKRGVQASIQPKATEPIHNLPALQDGNHGRSNRSHQTGGLYGENRSEGRLFFSSNLGRSPKIPKIPMEGKTVPISGSRIRFGTSPKDFHKSVETSYKSVSQGRNETDDLFGRSYLSQSKPRGIDEGFENRSLDFGELGIHHKLGEVRHSALSANGIPGVLDKHGSDDDIITRSEDGRYHSGMQSYVKGEMGHGENASEPNRQVNILYASGGTSPTTLQTPTDAKCEGTVGGAELRTEGDIERKKQGGNKMVDSVVEIFEWEVPEIEKGRNSNNERCLEQRMGGMVGLRTDWGVLDPRGTRLAYKCEGIEGWDDGYKGVYEIVEGCPCGHKYGQCDGCVANKQEIESGIGSVVNPEQGVMGILHAEGYNSHSSVSPRNSEPNSGFSVQTMAGFKRLEVGSGGIRQSVEEGTSHGSRFIRDEDEYSIAQICQLETGPRSHSDRQPAIVLVGDSRLCFPAILSDRPGADENLERGGHDSSDNPNLASTDMVSDVASAVYPGTDFVAANEEIVDEPTGSGAPLDATKCAETSGLDSVRQRVVEEGFSEEAAGLLMDKWRDSTKGSYEASWGKWASWARGWQINPFQATITDIVNFLSAMHREGRAYSTINGYRSAISAIHPRIGKCPVGENEDVCAVMAGIFKRNPPKPKYVQFWDVQTVLTYIKAMGPNDRLLVRDLAMKLAMLLALVTAGRSSDLSLLDTSFMVKKGDGYVFFIRDLGKTRKVGQPPPKVDIVRFEEDSNLDPVACLNEYLTRTKNLRPAEGSSLFLASVSPFKPVKSSTIAGWIKTILLRAGIDTSVWSAHSTRGASTSKASNLGVSIQTILETGCWKGVGTFKKFYKKPVLPETSKKEFAKAVLK